MVGDAKGFEVLMKLLDAGQDLALQCHPEARAASMERWFIGHAGELAGAGLSVPRLRDDKARFGPALETQGTRCFAEWPDGIGM